jgi:UDP-N-acetylglucosamine 2-epimerase (hydrolysing)
MSTQRMSSVTASRVHRKRVLFVTSGRADYAKLKPLILAFEGREDLETQVYVTGMHFDESLGGTWRQIANSHIRDVIYDRPLQDSGDLDISLQVARTIASLQRHFDMQGSPDLVFVHGDRGEALAAAIVGATRGSLVAHIEGGELSGSIDDAYRHSITKLSHLHLVANEQAARRVLQMGERADSVFVVGSPDIDAMYSSLPSLSQVLSEIGVFSNQYGIFVYHPVSSELDRLRRNIHELVEGLMKVGMFFVVIYPNSEPGSALIIETLQRLSGVANIRIVPNLPSEEFMSLLKGASVIAGNSSAVVREAPAYGIPSIAIGSRQARRYQSDGIIHISECAVQFSRAVQMATQQSAPLVPDFHFGRPGCVERVLSLFDEDYPWRLARQKEFQEVHQPECTHGSWQ